MNSHSYPGSARPPRSLPARLALGLVLGLEVLLMGLAGSAKFTNPDMWTGIFDSFGYPPEFAYVIGGAELVGVALLLVPRLSSWAAIGLAAIMLAALYSVLTNPNDLGATAPLIHLGLLGIIGAMRWERRWVPKGPARG